MSHWFAKAVILLASVVKVVIRAPHGQRSRAVPVERSCKGPRELTRSCSALLLRFTVLAAAVFVCGCGKKPAGWPTSGPATGAPASPDLLARPAGFLVWDYWRPSEPRPGSLFVPGGTITGRVKVIERWPPYSDLLMVTRSEYEKVREGMTYPEVRACIPGEVLLPFRFAPDSEYDLCCVQGDRIALFRFRGGTLVHKDQQGIE